MKKLSFKSCRGSKYCDDDIITAEHITVTYFSLCTMYTIALLYFIPTSFMRSHHVTSCLDSLEQLDVTLTHPNSVSVSTASMLQLSSLHAFHILHILCPFFSFSLALLLISFIYLTSYLFPSFPSPSIRSSSISVGHVVREP